MYKEILEASGNEQTQELTLKILTYEVGKINQIDVYMMRFGKTGFVGDKRTEMGDVLTMISLLIEQEGYSLEEVKQEGISRFKERMQNVRDRKL